MELFLWMPHLAPTCEPPIHIDGILFSSHMGANCLDHHELTSMQRFGGVVGCFEKKVFLTYATLKIIMFHCR